MSEPGSGDFLRRLALMVDKREAYCTQLTHELSEREYGLSLKYVTAEFIPAFPPGGEMSPDTILLNVNTFLAPMAYCLGVDRITLTFPHPRGHLRMSFMLTAERKDVRVEGSVLSASSESPTIEEISSAVMRDLPGLIRQLCEAEKEVRCSTCGGRGKHEPKCETMPREIRL